jgi:hypothetical protein
MDEEFAVLLFFFGISVTANIGLLIGLVRTGRLARRLENRLTGHAPRDDGRVERLEHSVETLDARIEQLARGQEFLSKLLAERRHLPPSRARQVTPH